MPKSCQPDQPPELDPTSIVDTGNGVDTFEFWQETVAMGSKFWYVLTPTVVRTGVGQ